MECEEDILFEAANALLLFSSSPVPPDLSPAATINLFKPHPLPSAAMPATSIENVLSVFLASWGVHSRRSDHMEKLKRKQVECSSPPSAEAAICGHRSPDIPLDLGAAPDLYSSGSDGFPCSSEIHPFKRLRTGEISVPGCDADIKLKRKQVEDPSPSTVSATYSHRSPDTPLDFGPASDPSSSESDGFMCSSETSVTGCDAHIKVSNPYFQRKFPAPFSLSNSFGFI